jgi:hypothetical protein
MFFTCLFCDEAGALESLKDIGLHRYRELCNTCGGDMTWSVDTIVSDGYRWRCRRRNGGTRCPYSRSIKHGSWFHNSNVTYLEILLITYGIVCRESALQILLSAHTVADRGIIPSSRGEHRVVEVHPRVVFTLTPHLFHQVQPHTIVIIFRLEIGSNFFNSLHYPSYQH